MRLFILALFLGSAFCLTAQTVDYRVLYNARQIKYWTTDFQDEDGYWDQNIFYVYTISTRDSIGGEWRDIGNYNIRRVPNYADWGCRYCFYWTDSWGHKESYGYRTPEELIEKIIAYLEKQNPH